MTDLGRVLCHLVMLYFNWYLCTPVQTRSDCMHFEVDVFVACSQQLTLNCNSHLHLISVSVQFKQLIVCQFYLLVPPISGSFHATLLPVTPRMYISQNSTQYECYVCRCTCLMSLLNLSSNKALGVTVGMEIQVP